ncbi:MAG: metalloregulator ArsR/SmtB family transcription factor [Gammaproteobacteria bacterium]|nr:metalloregulator ArsR/SmtB family transcription factor [Gammaproteobacteria bacterium]
MTYETMFVALADNSRRQIFESLRSGPASVTELSQHRPISRPAVSQHLKVLKQAGLVDVRAQGTKRIYSINRGGLDSLREYFEQFWTDALESYRQEVIHITGEKHAGSD